jgi:WD40 repeat protein
MTGHTNNVYGLKRISADMIASASFDTTLRIWNINNGNLVRNLTGHTNSLQYSIDYLSCSVLASGSVGTEGIILWNIFSGQSETISASGLQIQSLAISGVTSSEFSFFIFYFLSSVAHKGPCPLRGGYRPTLTKSYNLYTIL